MHHVNRNTDSHKWSWWIIIISKAILLQNTCLHVGASASKLLSSHLPPGRRRLWRVWRKWRRLLPAAERWSGGAWSLAWCRRCLHGAPCWLQKRQARSPLSETPLEGEMDTGEVDVEKRRSSEGKTKTKSPDRLTGVMTVRSGRWLPPAHGWLLRITSPSFNVLPRVLICSVKIN